MDYIKLPSRPQYREIMDKFLGYDKRLSADEGSFAEMQNLSSDKFPMLSPRPGRATALNVMGGTTGIIMKDELCFTCGTAFYHGDTRIDMGLSDEQKQLVSMGAYVLIFPDRKYINTADHADRGDIDFTFHAGTEVRVCLCRPNGEECTAEYVSDTEPEAPLDKSVWVNTSEYPNTLHQWSEAAKCWTSVTTTAVRILASGIGEHFSAGDGVTISGFDSEANARDFETNELLTEKQLEQLGALDGANVILERDKDWIVVTGIVDAKAVLAGIITVSRKMPVMDFIVEHGNRLWGCRYGLDDAGEFVNILYASKLGDFRNWSVYQGIDTDSYFAHVGTDGPFTGAIAWGYGDRVLFFKENGFHTVTGDGPSGFRVEYIDCPGIQKGSGGSVAVVDGVVYYKSPTSVYAYSGGVPQDIGGAFGGVRYRNACGGSYRHKYYISMADGDGVYHLFAFDSKLKLWHREDNTQVIGWADSGDNAWMLLPNGSRYSLNGSGGAKELGVKWSAQTGRLGVEHPDRKRLIRVNVRLRLGQGSRFALYIRYDSAGDWMRVAAATSARLRAYDFPVRVRRCDHMELRFEGQGDCEIYSIVKTYQMGSDRR